MNQLVFTKVSLELTESGASKVKEKEEELKLEDSLGEMGINMSSQGDEVELEDGDFEILENVILLDRSDYSSAEELGNGNTLISKKSGDSFEVVEDLETVLSQLLFLDKTWIEKQYYKIKNKLNKHK